jgi:hypothetical protein
MWRLLTTYQSMPPQRGKEMSELSTCKICLTDYDDEDMIEDIQGAKYCLLDSGDICLVCGIYQHQCETGE